MGASVENASFAIAESSFMMSLHSKSSSSCEVYNEPHNLLADFLLIFTCSDVPRFTSLAISVELCFVQVLLSS
jgi:hypothetical protein